jgi:hypothetical protein
MFGQTSPQVLFEANNLMLLLNYVLNRQIMLSKVSLLNNALYCTTLLNIAQLNIAQYCSILLNIA